MVYKRIFQFSILFCLDSKNMLSEDSFCLFSVQVGTEQPVLLYFSHKIFMKEKGGKKIIP